MYSAPDWGEAPWTYGSIIQSSRYSIPAASKSAWSILRMIPAQLFSGVLSRPVGRRAEELRL